MVTIRFSVPLVLLALGGCDWLVVGDGAFGITGTLPASVEKCEVALLSERGAEVPFSRRQARRELREDFTIAPHAAVYQVAVLCGGTVRKIATIRYGTEVKPGQRVPLGEIAP